ncbi:FAD-dependent oxidoreductase [Companilactobacillus nuruki]|uniref:FAD-dependent oxidoreductase n=1 Tax=Companilactobacillus nuruki TaxID=1993540 RepID=A0A2N7AUU5_9LACO|nr:FAD-dependent oxidoreductase [Companilactobacillus nuruki]PMD71410.1 FAD-dependent oxidoreductase [Companilactobacillus nuruki]
MKIVVLGASHGGFETVEELLATYDDLEIKWFEKNDLAAVIGWDKETTIHKIKELEDRQVEIFNKTEVIKVNAKEHKVEAVDRNGNKISESYDKLILSPGAKPNMLPVSGNDLKNIQTLGGREDMDMIREKAQDPTIENVVVVGAGYIGVGAVQILGMAHKNITLIDVSELPLSTYLDSEFTHKIMSEFVDKGVHLAMHNFVQNFVGNDQNEVTSVVTDKAEYPADLVVVAAGSHPNTEWLNGVVDMTERGLIKTDKYLHTSNPDIFAIGDVTEVFYNPGQNDMNISLASNARLQASYVVRNLKDDCYSINGVQGTSAWMAFDYKFAATGLNETTAKRLDVAIDSAFIEVDVPRDHTQISHILFKVVFDPKTRAILGAQIMSKDNLNDNINAISIAIQAKLTIDQLAYGDFFFEPGLKSQRSIFNLVGLKAIEKGTSN